MVNKYIVYTALFGKYDKLLEIHNMNKHIDYICFTDNKDLTSRTWNIIYVNDDKDIENLDNAEKNRYIKILSHKYISKEYEYSIYIDAVNGIIRDIMGLFDYAKKQYDENGTLLILKKHGKRDNLYDEIKACIKQNKAPKDILELQYKKYKDENFEFNELYNNTILIRKNNCNELIEFEKLWWDEFINFAHRDQISLPYLIKTQNFTKYAVVDLNELDYFIAFNNKHFYSKHGYKTALCCIERLENKYIRYFVEYYKNLGISKIFMYDANNETEDNVYDVIRDYIDSEYVKLIKWDLHEPKTEVLKAYQNCYDNRLNGFDYCCFFDPDEFLVLHHHDNIEDYLKDIHSDSEIIAINWLTYDDNNLIYYDDRPVTERFTNVSKFTNDNNKIKVILRTNVRYIDFLYGKAHCPRYNKLDTIVKDNAGNNTSTCKCLNLPYCDYTYAQLNHYRCKTIEEYFTNKYPKLVKYGYTSVNFDIDFFFMHNEYTEEKMEYYKKWKEQNL